MRFTDLHLQNILELLSASSSCPVVGIFFSLPCYFHLLLIVVDLHSSCTEIWVYPCIMMDTYALSFWCYQISFADNSALFRKWKGNIPMGWEVMPASAHTTLNVHWSWPCLTLWNQFNINDRWADKEKGLPHREILEGSFKEDFPIC